jgi:hypothetical protein
VFEKSYYHPWQHQAKGRGNQYQTIKQKSLEQTFVLWR